MGTFPHSVSCLHTAQLAARVYKICAFLQGRHSLHSLFYSLSISSHHRCSHTGAALMSVRWSESTGTRQVLVDLRELTLFYFHLCVCLSFQKLLYKRNAPFHILISSYQLVRSTISLFSHPSMQKNMYLSLTANHSMMAVPKIGKKIQNNWLHLQWVHYCVAGCSCGDLFNLFNSPNASGSSVCAVEYYYCHMTSVDVCIHTYSL